MWQAGTGRAAITPQGPLFLAGYGSRRPAAGVRHDLWVKALALEDASGTRAVVITSDLVGFCKPMYERLCAALDAEFGLERSRVMVTATHNHCAPVTTDVLPDYYPLAPEEWALVDEYTRWLEPQIVAAVREAIGRLAPARLSVGEGRTTFAANRRENQESEVREAREEGEVLKGPSDHSVPVLAVHGTGGDLQALLFGYACHPTTLADDYWCGDYPGYAQVALEQRHPGAMALFWTGCGGDQNPLPRRDVALCERYGAQLASAVERVLAGPLRVLEPHLRTAFEFVTLEFERAPTRAELEQDTRSEAPVRARWATRVLRELAEGRQFASSHPYGVQAWRLGDQLWIALGAEAVVDYALRFKREFGPRTWVCGYAHDMVAYIPSRRVWEEGGYEADYLYEYGWLAYRWRGDVEDRVASAVHRVVAAVTT